MRLIGELTRGRRPMAAGLVSLSALGMVCSIGDIGGSKDDALPSAAASVPGSEAPGSYGWVTNTEDSNGVYVGAKVYQSPHRNTGVETPPIKYNQGVRLGFICLTPVGKGRTAIDTDVPPGKPPLETTQWLRVERSDDAWVSSQVVDLKTVPPLCRPDQINQ